MKDRAKRIIVTAGIAAVLALIVQRLSYYEALPFRVVFGDMWMSRIRHGLIDFGVPSDFVCRYVAFALLHVPVWCVLFTVVFCLGFKSHQLAKVAALAFTMSLPVADFAIALYYTAFPPWTFTFSHSVEMATLFGFSARVLPAILTLLIGGVAWLLAGVARKLVTKRQKAEPATPPYSEPAARSPQG